MGVDNAIIATDFINCNDIIGMHYDTFDPIKINGTEAIKKFEHAGKKLSLLEIGQTITKWTTDTDLIRIYEWRILLFGVFLIRISVRLLSVISS